MFGVGSGRGRAERASGGRADIDGRRAADGDAGKDEEGLNFITQAVGQMD